MLLEVDGKKTYMINITNMNKNQNSNNNNSKSIKNDKKNIYNKIHKLKKNSTHYLNLQLCNPGSHEEGIGNNLRQIQSEDLFFILKITIFLGTKTEFTFYACNKVCKKDWVATKKVKKQCALAGKT